jgi:filamentous hemagglutinin
VTSGGDTTLKGALIDGKSVQAYVGGDLNIESLQDRSTYESKQKTAGISASICIPPFCTGTSSVSGNVGKSNSTGEYLSVVEQSGIKAGDGGFQITVGSNTDLKGGIISSTDAAITDGRNFLDTGTLTTSDLVNKSDANASSSGFGLSSNMLEGKYQTGKALLGIAINSADLSASSVGQTYSAVGEGEVVVRNEGKQIELTGRTAGQMIAELNRDTDDTNRSAEKHDVTAMQEAVNNVRSNREAIFNEATKFTDEAYRTMFISKAEFYVLIKDENGEVILGEDDRPLRRKLSEEEKLYLKVDAKGNVNIANNGIFNDEKAAAKYAEQHSTTNGEQYFIHFPEANGVTSELMIAGYQKYLEGDILGLTNATKEVKWALNHYGSSGLHLDGHSRGSMTIGNALQSLLNDIGAEGKLSQTTINLFGPAFNAEKADHLLGLLQGRDFKDPAVQQNFVIQLQNHYLDPVGALNGKNPATGGTLPAGSSRIKEILNVMFGDVTAHNCYGRGGSECRVYWDDFPKKQPESMTVNKMNKER